MRHQWASIHELARIGLFAALPGETLGKLAERMERVELGPGGQVDLGPDEALFVLGGLVGATAPGQPSRTLQAGAWLARDARIRAITPATVVRCSRADCEAELGPLPESR
ncbi:MAG: hypothetical protein R3C15_03260 [Thermoleophilia bacterium]